MTDVLAVGASSRPCAWLSKRATCFIKTLATMAVSRFTCGGAGDGELWPLGWPVLAYRGLLFLFLVFFCLFGLVEPGRVSHAMPWRHSSLLSVAFSAQCYHVRYLLVTSSRSALHTITATRCPRYHPSSTYLYVAVWSPTCIL